MPAGHEDWGSSTYYAHSSCELAMSTSLGGPVQRGQSSGGRWEWCAFGWFWVEWTWSGRGSKENQSGSMEPKREETYTEEEVKQDTSEWGREVSLKLLVRITVLDWRVEVEMEVICSLDTRKEEETKRWKTRTPGQGKSETPRFLSFSGLGDFPWKPQAGKMAPSNPKSRNYSIISLQLLSCAAPRFVTMNVYNRTLKPNKTFILAGKYAPWNSLNRSHEKGIKDSTPSYIWETLDWPRLLYIRFPKVWRVPTHTSKPGRSG